MNKWPFVVILPIIAVVAILNIFIPRKVWRVTARWQYKHPEAVEPTDFVFGLQRIVGVAVLGVVTYIFITKIL